MPLSDAVVALGQASVAATQGFDLSQYGPLGIVAGGLLALFGVIFKKLIDSVLKQNVAMQQQYLAKLDEINQGIARVGAFVGELREMKISIIAEMAGTKQVINQLSADVIQELEALRTDAAARDPRRSTTDTPLPAPLPRRRPTMPPGGLSLSQPQPQPQPGQATRPPRR
jgi:hypothetical protein